VLQLKGLRRGSLKVLYIKGLGDLAGGWGLA
jgi:hypothetical protein